MLLRSLNCIHWMKRTLMVSSFEDLQLWCDTSVYALFWSLNPKIATLKKETCAEIQVVSPLADEELDGSENSLVSVTLFEIVMKKSNFSNMLLVSLFIAVCIYAKCVKKAKHYGKIPVWQLLFCFIFQKLFTKIFSWASCWNSNFGITILCCSASHWILNF